MYKKYYVLLFSKYSGNYLTLGNYGATSKCYCGKNYHREQIMQNYFGFWLVLFGFNI